MMKFQAKKMLFAAITVATISSTSLPSAFACGGSGGGRRGGISTGFGGGFGGSRHRVSSAPLRRSTPVYHSAPVYQNAPAYQPAPVHYNAPTSHSVTTSYSAPINSQPVYSQQSFNTSVQTVKPRVAVPTTSQRVANRQPVNQPSVKQAPTQPAPAKKPSTSATANSEASAIAMLASINGGESKPAANQIPQFSPAKAAAAADDTTKAHVGKWSVSLPGNQAVTLELSDSGSFTWTASKDGKSNSFSGQYRLKGDRLALVRSTDLQKMEGSWTGSANGFTFKVDGETAGGLSFSRS